MARLLVCDDCGRTPRITELAPELQDTVWRNIAQQRELLCAQCMFTRAVAREVRLALASLKPCPFNLICSPVSWFELFSSVELRPPTNLDAWRSAAIGLPNAPASLTQQLR